MNSRARRIKFGDTLVMDSIVVTHFLNPVVGMASLTSEVVRFGEPALRSSMADKVLEASNQKRQVI